MLITLAMGCCPGKEREKEGKKEGKMKSISIDTDALVMEVRMMMMIFSPVCGRGCHPKSARAREAMVTERKNAS